MLPIAFFSWWYGAGWHKMGSKFSSRTAAISEALSMRLLSSTLFQPWRRIISSSGRGLAAQFSAMLDNAVSRTIGAIVRGAVLLFGLLVIAGSMIATVLEILIWPLLPVLPLALLVGALLYAR